MEKCDWEIMLRELKKELEALDNGAAGGRATVQLDQSRVGRLSRMDALQGQAMNKAIAARRRQRLLAIDAALDRLSEEEFGYCIKCGDEIALKRLDIDPTVATCSSCSD